MRMSASEPCFVPIRSGLFQIKPLAKNYRVVSWRSYQLLKSLHKVSIGG